MRFPTWRDNKAFVINQGKVIDVIEKGRELIVIDREDYVLRGYGFRGEIVDIYVPTLYCIAGGGRICNQVETALAGYSKDLLGEVPE